VSSCVHGSRGRPTLWTMMPSRSPPALRS
jgi:hypothetical protein